MFNRRKHFYMALALLLLALSACRFGLPSGRDRETPVAPVAGEGGYTPTVPVLVTPTPTLWTGPTPTQTSVPRLVVTTPTRSIPPTPTPTSSARLDLTTPTPTPTLSARLVLTTPTPTLPARLVVTTPEPTSSARLILSTPTTSGQVDGLPEPPHDGPLPALWLEIEFGAMEERFTSQGQTELGRAASGAYSVHDLALDAQQGILYALGVCSPEFNSSAGIPNQCISAFDLDEDRLLPPGAVELPPDIRGEGRLYVAGDTLYLHQRWAGILSALDVSALDAGTLAVRETISDVYGMALDGSAGAPYIVTSGGLSRLGSGLPGSLVARKYDSSPVDMAAAGGRVYVLADGVLQVYDASLTLVAALEQEGAQLHGLALDPDNRRLYIGSYDGLCVLDLATDRLARTPADVGNVWGMVVDAAGQRLFVLADRSGDWFGQTDVLAIDTQSWETQTLFSTQSGQLRDLVYDEHGHRVLVASADDHALIPIDLASGEVRPRLPLGIEIVEVVVSTSGDRLYVSDSAGYIHVLDRRTYAEIGRVYGGRHISLDGAHGRLYAGDERLPVVSVYDARTLELERVLPQAGKPRANPATGEVVIVNRKFYVYDGASGRAAGELLPGVGEPPAECPGCYYTIAREVTIDARRGLTATTTYTPWPGKPGPQESIDHDPVSGRATYGLVTGGYVHYSSVAVYPDLGTLQAREQPLLYLEGLGGQIKLDPVARRLYVARGDTLFVLDSETLNRVGRVYTDGPGPRTDGPRPRWTPTIAAVDEELGRLYSLRGSRLLVWTRAGGAHPPVLPAVPAVVTHTVTSILPSPNYALDGTLLATIDGQLVRSTDRGRTWLRLQGGLPRFEDYTYNVHAAFSPEYATDRCVFAGLYLGDTHGEGVYCSEDGGDTWTPCSDGLYDLRVSRVVPSPNFGRDRTLIAYARTQTGEAVYRSINAGKRWQLVLRQTDYGTPRLPRVEELFPQDRYLPQFRCDFQGACERSDDGGGTWTHVDTGGVQLDRYVAYALSPHYARDGVVYFLAESRLYRYRDRDQTWSISTLPIVGASTGGERDYSQSWTGLAVAATGRDTHDLFLGSAAGEFYRFSASALPWAAVVAIQSLPAATPLPTPCVRAIDSRFEGIDRADMEGLGCPVVSGKETGAAFQPFERGSMLWREDLRRIYVLQADGTWDSYEDAWTSDQAEPDLSPPQGLYRPVRGFGRVWSLDLDGPPSPIGWATAPERGYAMVVQPFARGLLLTGAQGEVYALHDDGTWQHP